MRIKKTIGEIEEVICETNLNEVPNFIIETDADALIVVSGWWVMIPSLDIYLREGIVCVYDEEENDYLPDFAVTVMMEGELVEDGLIYYEQDGFLISLANFLQGRRGLEDLESLECELCVPDMETSE
jgi:hypothetical protein